MAEGSPASHTSVEERIEPLASVDGATIHGVGERQEAEDETGGLSSPQVKMDWQETLVSLMAAQQQQLFELTRRTNMATEIPTMTSGRTQPSTSSVVSFRLAEFDPEENDHPIEEWLAVATRLKEEEYIGDGLMIAKAGEALKGSAHRYYCNWRPVLRTWDEFCKDLIVAFPDRETAGARAFTAATLRSTDCESLSEYGIRKLRAIDRFYAALPWNIRLSMVEYGLNHGETQAAIRMQQPGTDRELLKVLSEYDARRRKGRKTQAPRSTEPISLVAPEKRQKRGPKGVCYRCGQKGHHKANCDIRLDKDQKGENSAPAEKSASGSRPPTCTHCHKLGHTEPNCWYKHGKPKRALVFKK
ncbi:hypothetical protein Zmor_011064 [Zophobas morio]|uniref:CCHC-type domain-containing protein n=1 Tax=Zophobas morio TaxID=2755281 RepID=A0AA38IQY7_9CUCU|nr:hypothetical protein Zmor_011064 [Zophobas morio]